LELHQVGKNWHLDNIESSCHEHGLFFHSFSGFFIDGFYDIEVCALYPYTLKSFDQERILYPARLLLKIGGDIKTFQDK